MERVPSWELHDVVARLGHQLRNPLTTIQSGIQLVQVLTQPRGDTAGYLEDALREVARIDSILKDFQRLVRLSSGQCSAVRLEDLVSRAVSSCDTAGCTTVVQTGPPDLHAVVDGELLLVAIEELTRRAVAVTQGADSVGVRWGQDTGQPAWIEITDAGPTEPGGSLRAIQAAWPGSGLGLNLAERAGSLLGGYLEWETVHPHGHRFRIVLQRG